LGKEIDFLTEWAVWAHLDSTTDLEKILLKGHLLLEIILDTTLKRNAIQNFEDLSFFRKITIIEKIDFDNSKQKDLIILSLKEINQLRNRFAHEFNFEIKDGRFELWATNILKNFEGTKFTKYTFRTKAVHSFSILSKNILDLTALIE
jgi:hypothetical protein